METTHDYGQLILKHNNNNINIHRIRLYQGQMYNWWEPLVWNGNLQYHTDQTVDLCANPSIHPIKEYREVWLDGVCIYKRPWWRKLF